jgi:CMP/dCMP kinase
MRPVRASPSRRRKRKRRTPNNALSGRASLKGFSRAERSGSMGQSRATLPARYTSTAAGGRGQPLVIQTSRPIVITIDGPAGTGKSSVARILARRLGLDFLDTGAMYRAVAALVLDQNIPLRDEARIVETVRAADIHFDWTKDPPSIMAWGQPLDRRIRESDVTAIVSKVAANKELRRLMVARQREIAGEHKRLVTEGRDQGSAVFPSAPVKFYLDADPLVRARRRAEQIREMMGEVGASMTEERLLRDIMDRDASDSSRAVGPLVCAEDAVRVDTTELTFDQVVDTLEDLVRERVESLD